MARILHPTVQPDNYLEHMRRRTTDRRFMLQNFKATKLLQKRNPRIRTHGWIDQCMYRNERYNYQPAIYIILLDTEGSIERLQRSHLQHLSTPVRSHCWNSFGVFQHKLQNKAIDGRGDLQKRLSAGTKNHINRSAAF